MNCTETEELIHGYVDGELDLIRSLAVEQHLKDCSRCAAIHEDWKSLHKTIGAGSLYFNTPPGLERRVRAAVRHASREEVKTGGPWWRWSLSWPSILAPLGAAALALVIALPVSTRHAAQDRLSAQIVSAHVRSLMADTSHLTDVASSDQHTVKPWFTGKLPFSPSVVDLAAQGFPLIGGRLDYIEERPVAALVYQRRKHLINLFVWPQQTASTQKTLTRQGYNVVRWSQSGMAYSAVSDVNPGELQIFQRLLQDASPAR